MLEPEIGAGEGNAYSSVITLPDFREQNASILLDVDKRAPRINIRTSKEREVLEVRSKLLSTFHRRPVTINAAVVLPPSYFEQPQQRYPVLFDIPSFGGTHHFPRTMAPTNDRGIAFIRVELDGSCPLGHHAFADSANNGPCGSAFVQEFIPALDAHFRTIRSPTARFLTGISSGGWSSLWLQVNHPDVFNGVWSYSPDPVDFGDFQNIDLYSPDGNLFRTPAGSRRPLARSRTATLIWFDELSRLEEVLGPGGQLHSFEAVFGPRDSAGNPAQLWNRVTGVVDSHVAAYWRQYDIRRVLETNWGQLADKLRGKLHVHVDEQDSFFLEGAVIRLQSPLDRLGSDAVVVVHPTFGHGTFMTEDFLKSTGNEMADRFLLSHPQHGRTNAFQPIETMSGAVVRNDRYLE